MTVCSHSNPFVMKSQNMVWRALHIKGIITILHNIVRHSWAVRWLRGLTFPTIVLFYTVWVTFLSLCLIDYSQVKTCSSSSSVHQIVRGQMLHGLKISSQTNSRKLILISSKCYGHFVQSDKSAEIWPPRPLDKRCWMHIHVSLVSCRQSA